MTYKELVNAIEGIVDSHYMLQEFGYGDLSDIKANIQADKTNYPYAFLNPQQHTRLERSVIYRFNLIVMDMALNEDHLTVQSDCAQYIDDILAEIKYNLLNRYDVDVNFTLTPFNERFQDVVAGMTLQLDIEVPNVLNLCVAPIPAAETYVLNVKTTTDQTFRPDVTNNPIAFLDVIQDTLEGMRPLPQSNFYTVKAAGTWRFVLTGRAKRTTANYTPFTTGFDMRVTAGASQTFNEADVSNWPTNPALNEEFDFELEWRDWNLTNPTEILFNTPNEPELEDQFQLLTGARLRAYYIPA